MNKWYFWSIIFSLGVFLASPTEVQAAFSLEADPVISQNTIDFGELHAGEESLREVRLKVTNDTAAKYRITQTLNSLPTNALGDTLVASLISIYIKDGSQGTVEARTPIQMSSGNLLLYTSNDSGSGDSMTVVYYLSLPSTHGGGTFTTTLTYTLEPLSGATSASVQSVTLNWTVTVRPSFEIHLKSATGASELTFYVKEPDQASELEQILQIEVHGELGTQYRIMHQLREPLRSEAGLLLPEEALTAEVEGEVAQLVSTQPVEVLTSDSQGKGTIITIRYRFSLIPTQSAGTYRSTLVYSVEPSSILPIGVAATYLFPLTLVIEPRFDLLMSYPQGKEGISFGSIKPAIGSQPEIKTQEVQFQVVSNMGKPYQVVQLFQTPLVQEEGARINEENFKVMVRDFSLGNSDFSDQPKPVPIGAGSVLYTSDSQGSPVTFNVAYQLWTTSNTRRGNYQTSVVFTLVPL